MHAAHFFDGINIPNKYHRNISKHMGEMTYTISILK